MIIDQAVYRNGVRQPCGDLRDELESLHHEDGGFLWVGLKDPNPEELELMAQELPLHPLAVEDALAGGQRPKMEIYGDSAFVVMRTLRYIDRTSDVETGELMVFLGKRFVVTVRRGEPTPLENVRAALEHDPELLAKGPAAVLYSVMDAVVDKYLQIDIELMEDIRHIERRVFRDTSQTDVTDVYELKREILEARWAATPLIDPVRRILNSNVIDADFMPFFRDILDHLLLVNEHVETYDRQLSDVLSVQLSQVSVQQNDDMRKISAWAAIMTVPTMLAGLYGMNFHSIPELEASVTVGHSQFYYGYYVLLLVMATVCFLLWRAFKKTGWL